MRVGSSVLASGGMLHKPAKRIKFDPFYSWEFKVKIKFLWFYFDKFQEPIWSVSAKVINYSSRYFPLRLSILRCCNMLSFFPRYAPQVVTQKGKQYVSKTLITGGKFPEIIRSPWLIIVSTVPTTQAVKNAFLGVPSENAISINLRLWGLAMV